MSDRQTLVIIGHGMTSHALCKRLVECGVTRGELDVVVLGEEPRPAYDRVHLTDLLAGKSERDLTLAPLGWYEEHEIELLLGDPPVAIDRDECVVRVRSGFLLPFDRLVLATGSRPFVPPIPGADLPGVFVYRTIDDLLAILVHAGRSTRALVIGGGLLGLEAARAVHGLGLQVTVLEASSGLLARQLDNAAAGILRGLIEDLGLRVRTGARTVRIEGGPGPKTVHLTDGSIHEADLVIFAAGVRPRAELAVDARLTIARNGGVVVDDRLATSDERIFAVGECAAHRGVSYGLFAPGLRMVDVLVNNLGGGDAVFTGASRSSRLKLLGVDVASLGEHDEAKAPGSAVHIYTQGPVYRKLVVMDGQIIGAMAVGPWEDLARIEEAIQEPRRFSFWDLRRFRSTGSLFLRSESPPVHLWAPDALVCGCLGVRRLALSQAEAAGCADIAALSARTGAGTMCGSCRPLLADFLQGQRTDSLPPSGLHAASEPPPETLRCKPGGGEDTSLGPLSLRLPPPPPRPRLSTLPSVVSSSEILAQPRAALEQGGVAIHLCEPVPESGPSLVHASSTFGASGPRAAPRPEPSPTSDVTTSRPSSRWPGARVSTIPDSTPSGPASIPPPSARRETLPPLRPLSVPSERLPTIPPPRSLPAPSPRDARLRRALVVSSGLSLALACAAFVLPPLGPATSFRGAHLATLLAGSVARQVSGYAVVAFSVAGLLLSAAKRIPRFAPPDVPAWRAVHGVLGAAAVLSLFAHTGLHLGEHHNRLLVLDFLALSALGAVAGLVAAGGGLDPAATARRVMIFRAHLVVFLPLPVLVALHVLGAYYF